MKRTRTSLPQQNFISSIVEENREMIEEDIFRDLLEAPEPDLIESDADVLAETVGEYKIEKYRNGGEGFVQWVEDFVHLPIYPIGSQIPIWTPISDLPKEPHPTTGRSYYDFWERQKEVFIKALEMENGYFKHKLIVFCWMRGEGKSAGACLIQSWKFMCWPRQVIVLGANSKEQTKFVHFDIIKDIFINSPRLLDIVGLRNIQEKEIRLLDRFGKVASLIKPISSFSGIMSNITGYTFSEMFDMKNPKFFTQLDGSTRNIPNSMGVIDSTVAEATHILTHLHNAYKKGEDPYLFFSYRYSLNADYRDYWHPYNDQKQLDSYKSKFLPVEFDRYFKNIGSTGVNKVFPSELVKATKVLGVDKMLGGGQFLMRMLRKEKLIMDQLDEDKFKGQDGTVLRTELAGIRARLWPVDSVYTLANKYGTPVGATSVDLEKLGDIYNTNWAILTGVDRADPMKTSVGGARTIFTAVAKGLPGSRSGKPKETDGNPAYIYILLRFFHLETSSLEDIKHELKNCKDDFYGVDTLCSERWAMWDIQEWCETEGIEFEAIHPNYAKQREAVSELYIVMNDGRFKAPFTGVQGSKTADLLEEELLMFDHDKLKQWFGSPEKEAQHGIQDDSVYALMWCIYGGRFKTVDDFIPRSSSVGFYGTFVPNKDLRGKYR